MRAALAALAFCLAPSPRAHAFGGLWSPPQKRVEQSATQVIFVDNQDGSITAVIQVKYAGAADHFAWLIPVPGTPEVGVSSSTIFQRLDAATSPQYWVEVDDMCIQPDDPDAPADPGADTQDTPNLPSTDAPVAIMDQGSVGAYDYVTLQVDPMLTDPAQAASDWLQTNGYDLTGLESDVLSPYLSDGLNLIAFKLRDGKDAGSIRPITLTYQGDRPMIPIQPAAVAAQADMGIQVWVIGPSQAVPDNYKSLVLNDARIDWLSGPTFSIGTLPAGGVGPVGPHVDKPTNYDAVVSAAAREAGGQGFVTELAAPMSLYRDMVWAALDEQTFQTISSQSYADGVDAVLAAASEYGGWDGWKEALEAATTLPDGVTLDDFGSDPDRYRGAARVDTGKFMQLLREDVIDPISATAALLRRAPYLTRLYSRMSPDALTLDPTFDYNFDLAQVSNIHIAKQSIPCDPTLEPGSAPWQISLPQGSVVAGQGAGWPTDVDALPANLKVVALSNSGSGSVVTDNSEAIGMTLFDTGTRLPMPRPEVGVTIGGTQRVTLPGSAIDAPADSPDKPSAGGCSVSHPGANSAYGFPLLASLWGLRLRRRQRGRES